MLWRDDTEYAREVIEWMDGFKKQTGNEVESVDPDSIEGEIFATTHDILQFPTLVIVDQNSSILSKWSGKLPQYEEVTYIIRSV